MRKKLITLRILISGGPRMPIKRIFMLGMFFVLGATVLFTLKPATVFAESCSYLLNTDFKEAEKTQDYERFIEQNSPCELAFVAVQRLARPYLQNKDWQGAIGVFEKYRKDFPGMEKRFAAIIAILETPEEGLVIKNLGPEINTEQGEFRPVLAVDGKRLYFGRNCGECDGGEDIFVSDLEDEGWQTATELGRPISTKAHEMPTGISSGGNKLFLFGNYPGSLGRGDIFYSEKTPTCWSEVKHYPAPVNSAYFDSDAMMAADGKAVVFVSERPDGIGDFHGKDEFYHGSYGGNTDIYVYAENDSGEFEIINLGSTINTPYSEYSPFLHPDGKTLYFSSDGHSGLGGLDVYKATRMDPSSWTEWSPPVNLGKEINGPNNDWGYQISTSGRFAYFSAAGKPEGYGANDIYAIEMPARAKPLTVITVSGKVTDPAGRPLDAKIQWNNLSLRKKVGENVSDPGTGKYVIALPAGYKYSYFAEKEGYIGMSQFFDLRDMEGYTEYTLDIVLYPVSRLMEEKVAIRFNNIFFDFDKYDLREESYLELDRWADFLKKNAELEAEIQGHTDYIGTDAYNQTLSEKRAQAVIKYLVRKGIDPERIAAKGFGESQPIDTNETKEGRQQNRRVEIKFGARN